LADSLSQDDLEHIRQLLKLVEDNGLIELKVSEPTGLAVDIGAGSRDVPQTMLVPMSAAQPGADATAAELAREHTQSAKPVRKGVPLESPMVGVFYRAQTPEDPPFAREGEVVQIGQTIGLIEAMKVFSEIPAERSGRIIEFVATNGQLIQLGQAIAFVEPL